jgi:hypothetical protein
LTTQSRRRCTPFFLKAEPGTTPQKLREIVALRIASMNSLTGISSPLRNLSAMTSSKSETASISFSR